MAVRRTGSQLFPVTAQGRDNWPHQKPLEMDHKAAMGTSNWFPTEGESGFLQQRLDPELGSKWDNLALS